MQRDSLVHVAATGGYGSVFEVDDKGVCEVGLIDPCADDYSLRVPAHALIEIESVGKDQLDELLDALALFHLGELLELFGEDGLLLLTSQGHTPVLDHGLELLHAVDAGTHGDEVGQ